MERTTVGEAWSVTVDASTSVKYFMTTVNEKSPSKKLTIMDLQPFDPSIVGHWAGGPPRGRGYMHWDPSEPVEPRTFVTQNPDAKPNCFWDVDAGSPDQPINKAGLCDGAELCFIQICYSKG